MKKIIVLILGAAAMLSCKGNENDYTEEKLDFQYPTENLVGTFDYNVLKNMEHPRVMLNSEAWEKIKAARSTDARVNEVCDIVTTVANGHLGKADMIYELDAAGKRLLAVSGEALSRISYCAAAYRLTGDEKYLARVERDMTTVCKFSDWHPSHFLDVGEMALAVALGYDWCYDGLSEETKALCRKAISAYAFYATDCGNTQFKNKSGNWNQVCSCGIMMSALAFFEDQPSRYMKYLDEYYNSLKVPMKAYEPDGAYFEGYGYWEYGTGYHIMTLIALESIFGNDGGMSDTPGFEKTCDFIMFMDGPAGGFNYGDNNTARFNVFELWYFAKKFNNPSLLYFEKNYMDNNNAYRRWPSVVMPMLVLPYIVDAKLDGIQKPSKNVYYGRGYQPVVIARTTWSHDSQEKYVGIKAGCCNRSHAHMDVGSFVYDSKGYRWATDSGREAYASVEVNVSDFWTYGQNSGRWTKVMRMRPEYHNTLTVKGKLHDVTAFIDFDEIFDTEAERGGSFDMAPALSNGVDKAQRSIKIINNEYLEVKDHIEVSKDLTICWNFIPPANATVINDHCIQLHYGVLSTYLNIESDKPIRIVNEIIKNANSWDTIGGRTHTGFECDLKAGEVANFRVTITDELPE